MESSLHTASQPAFALPAALAAGEMAPGAVSLRAQLVHRLREAILSGALKPGERLSDAQLCEDYGVSRTSVREALRYLESEKLITVLRNRRAAVARLTAREAATIYALLAGVLGDAAAMLAGSLTPLVARQFTLLLAGLEAEAASGVLRPQLAQLHLALLRGCGDTVLQEIGGSLLARIAYLQSRALAVPYWPDEAVAVTRRLVAALAARQPEAARAAARAYFQTESKVVTNVLAG